MTAASPISPLALNLEDPPTIEAIERRRVMVAQLRQEHRIRPLSWVFSALALGAVWSYPLFVGGQSLVPPGLAATVVAGGYCLLAWQINTRLSLSQALRLEAFYLEDLDRQHCADMRTLCASYPEAEIYRLKVLQQGRRFINADFELLNTLPEQEGADAYEAACKALYGIPS